MSQSPPRPQGKSRFCVLTPSFLGMLGDGSGDANGDDLGDDLGDARGLGDSSPSLPAKCRAKMHNRTNMRRKWVVPWTRRRLVAFQTSDPDVLTFNRKSEPPTHPTSCQLSSNGRSLPTETGLPVEHYPFLREAWVLFSSIFSKF